MIDNANFSLISQFRHYIGTHTMQIRKHIIITIADINIREKITYQKKSNARLSQHPHAHKNRGGHNDQVYYIIIIMKYITNTYMEIL